MIIGIYLLQWCTESLLDFARSSPSVMLSLRRSFAEPGLNLSQLNIKG